MSEADYVRVADSDARHAALKAAIEVQTHRYLWTPADGIDFIPRLCNNIFGDGRALLAFTTINNRPAFWVVRIDSSWELSEASAPDNSFDVAEISDDILTALEHDFGCARWENDDGVEVCDDFPAVDDSYGCSWWRVDVPKGLESEPHPFARSYTVLPALNGEQ